MGRLSSGLVSVTFRPLGVEQVVRLAVEAGISAIEWGGDIHVPHGDLPKAREARRLCELAGLRVYAYGSYYRVAATKASVDFSSVLDSAVELGAPSIRVWACDIASERADDALRQRVVDDLRAVADRAASKQIRIALEYHGGTLTDTVGSAVDLLTRAGHPNVRTYWQPRHGQDVQTHLTEIDQLRTWLDHVHVFHWWPDANHRLPLSEGWDRWQAFLGHLQADGRDRVAALEFVRGDSPDQYRADAGTLNRLIEDLPSASRG
jgi:3-dehydroshikimate dehydratase